MSQIKYIEKYSTNLCLPSDDAGMLAKQRLLTDESRAPRLHRFEIPSLQITLLSS